MDRIDPSHDVTRQKLAEPLFTTTFLSLLKRAERVMVSTGAGISTESGIPPFRGPDGLWENFKPEELATPEAFGQDPKKVWRWYDWRRQMIGKAEPNSGHVALVNLEEFFPRFFLFTQNIDGLHQRAGNKNVHELHGNIWRVRCLKEEGRVYELLETPIRELPPHCICGSLVRPDVVWFGEPLPSEVLLTAREVASNCDFFFLIGSSAVVEPAASLAWLARDRGAVVVEINDEITPVTEIANECFLGKAGTILPQLMNALKTHV
jgi:NAD-dependent deacetylase